MYKADDSRYSSMKYSRCGASGLKLPSLSLGLWHNFGDTGDYGNMKKMCFSAFDNGITHFDLADNYGPGPGSAEINFGRILKEDLGVYRDELIISTKAGYDMWDGPYGSWGSRKHLLAGLDKSLSRLKLDYVDIYYHHRPDPGTPLEESMQALDSAVKSGKALYAGISNYNRDQTEKAMNILFDLKCPFIINQSRYSIFDRHIEHDGLKDFAFENGCGLIAFSPLAQGLLTDKYLRGIPSDSRMRTDGRFLSEKSLTPEIMAAIESLNMIALERSQTLAQMAVSWILRDGKTTSVLIGASRPDQITENIKALENTVFSPSELDLIDNFSLLKN